jgi:hypothetical protein
MIVIKTEWYNIPLPRYNLSSGQYYPFYERVWQKAGFGS